MSDGWNRIPDWWREHLSDSPYRHTTRRGDASPHWGEFCGERTVLTKIKNNNNDDVHKQSFLSCQRVFVLFFFPSDTRLTGVRLVTPPGTLGGPSNTRFGKSQQGKKRPTSITDVRDFAFWTSVFPHLKDCVMASDIIWVYSHSCQRKKEKQRKTQEFREGISGTVVSNSNLWPTEELNSTQIESLWPWRKPASLTTSSRNVIAVLTSEVGKWRRA